MHTVFLKLRQTIFDVRMELWLSRAYRAIVTGRVLPRAPRFVILLVVTAAVALSACEDSVNCCDGWKRGGGVTRTIDSTRSGHRR